MNPILGLAFLGAPTYNLPHAADVDSHVQFGSGAAFLRMGPLPNLRIAGTYSKEALAINASYTGYFGQDLESFSVLGVRYQVFKKGNFRLAPTIMIADHHGISAYDARTTGRLGLALSGGEIWQWDVALNAVGVQWYPVRPTEIQPLAPLDCLLAMELGVARQIGSHWFRIGLLGPMPSFSYRTTIKKLHLRLTGATLGNQNLAQVEGGFSF